MKTIIKKGFNILTFTLVMVMFFPNQIKAQDEPVAVVEEAVPEVKKENKPVKSPYEAGMLVETQTYLVWPKKTLEFVIQHRFGKVNNTYFDMLGLYAPSNIKLGINYGLFKNAQIGIGSTKVGKLVDLNYKYAILTQTQSNSMPIAVTYYGNTELGVDSKKSLFGDKFRYTYFNQLIIGRKFSKAVTLQVSAMHAHFNIIDTLSLEPPVTKHSNFGFGVAGRVKFSPQGSVMFEYAMPLTTPKYADIKDTKGVVTNSSVKPNLSFGVEFATSGHTFQIFLTTYDKISPQGNLMYNTNDFTKQDVVIGFNITRNWGF